MSGWKELVVELYTKWAIAGLILSALSAVAAALGGLEGFLPYMFEQFVFSFMYSLIPFPFDLLVSWAIEPWFVLGQVVICITLFVLQNLSWFESHS